MAYFLFIDESGIDRRDSPYEVLAGISVHETRVWSLITAMQQAEVRHFGSRLTRGELEMKGKKLLKRKTFRLARMEDPIPQVDRVALAGQCLEEGQLAKQEGREPRVNRRQLAALGQAKVAFCEEVFETCGHHQVRTFASIVPKDAPRQPGDFLRKDYAYLFERFFYYLDSRYGEDSGVVVFDELERSQCTILIEQMFKYFLETAIGKHRATRIIPEPFFVHSELSTLIQVADLLAYIIVWGVRVGHMSQPARPELRNLANAVCQLRFKTNIVDDRNQEEYPVWSFAIIDDLRPREEKDSERK